MDCGQGLGTALCESSENDPVTLGPPPSPALSFRHICSSSSALSSWSSGGELLAAFSLQIPGWGRTRKYPSSSHLTALMAPKALLPCRPTRDWGIIEGTVCHSDRSGITFPRSRKRTWGISQPWIPLKPEVTEQRVDFTWRCQWADATRTITSFQGDKGMQGTWSVRVFICLFLPWILQAFLLESESWENSFPEWLVHVEGAQRAPWGSYSGQ